MSARHRFEPPLMTVAACVSVLVKRDMILGLWVEGVVWRHGISERAAVPGLVRVQPRSPQATGSQI